MSIPADTDLEQSIERLNRSISHFRKSDQLTLIAAVLGLASLGLDVSCVARPDRPWAFWWAIGDSLGIAFCFVFHSFLKRRITRLECARTHLKAMIEHRFSSIAFEHHYDQARAALERL